MKPRLILTCLKPLLILVVSCYLQTVHADTRTYSATTDFPVIDAGRVPYYSEAPTRASLAINPANESQRNAYARAEVVYDGNAGIHDITIVALAETSGEATYRLKVNGNIVGTATNPEVTVDYTVIRHTFESINIPAGAVLGVESLANTNGRLSEQDGSVFARGRWSALELLEENDQTLVQSPTDMDLGLTLSSNKSSASLNEAFELDLTVTNAAASVTATQPVVSVSIALQALTLVSANQCTETALGLDCTFPELPAGSSQTLSLSFMSTDVALPLIVQAFVSADQDDRDEANNMATLDFTITDNEAEPEPEPEFPENPGGILIEDETMSRSGGGAMSTYSFVLLLAAMLRLLSSDTRRRCRNKCVFGC